MLSTCFFIFGCLNSAQVNITKDYTKPMDEFTSFKDKYQILQRLDEINQEIARALIILAHNEDMIDMATNGATNLLDDIRQVNLNFGLSDRVDGA